MIRALIEQPRLMPCLILIFCLAALGIAISSELFGGLKPCILCIWQRYVYAGIIAIALLGLIVGGNTRYRAIFVGLAGLGFLVGAGVAGFIAVSIVFFTMAGNLLAAGLAMIVFGGALIALLVITNRMLRRASGVETTGAAS